MIFLSLRVTADAGGGLKIRAHQRPDYRGLGAAATNKHAPGIYPRIACRYYRTPPHTINYFALFQPQSGQQVHWDAYQAH